MRVLTNRCTNLRRWMTGTAMLGLAALGLLAAPQPAQAWWRGGCCAVGFGIGLPPVVIAPPVYAPPPPVYYAPPPPAYYYPPQPYAGAVWVPGGWAGGVWVGGHWRR